MAILNSDAILNSEQEIDYRGSPRDWKSLNLVALRKQILISAGLVPKPESKFLNLFCRWHKFFIAWNIFINHVFQANSARALRILFYCANVKMLQSIGSSEPSRSIGTSGYIDIVVLLNPEAPFNPLRPFNPLAQLDTVTRTDSVVSLDPAVSGELGFHFMGFVRVSNQ